MRLGFILEPEAPNSNYRVTIPMLALERGGHAIAWPDDIREDVGLKHLLACDLVHCFRRPDRTSDLKRLASYGVAISFDNDDDLRAVNVSADSVSEARGTRARLENMNKFSDMLKIARLADVVTTPSEVLAETYRSSGAKHVAVIENYLDDRLMSGYGSRTKHDGTVIGWVAGKEHELDLPRLSVTDALGRLLDAHEELRVLTVGSRLTLKSARYEFRKEVPFEMLVELCGGFDVGIAPLADTQFNRSRSNVKLKEYAAGGAPWLASAVGPYRAMGKREGGMLVRDDRWLEALEPLVSSGVTRWRLARRAHKWAAQQTIDKNVWRWEQEFSAAIDRARLRASGRDTGPRSRR